MKNILLSCVLVALGCLLFAQATVTITIETDDAVSPIGGLVKLIDDNGDPDNVYELTVDSGNEVVFTGVAFGDYRLVVDYNDYWQADASWMRIDQDPFAVTVNLLKPQILLFEDFSNELFPPEGWYVVDMSFDGYEWHRYESGYSGNYSVASQSKCSDDGTCLTPQDYIILPLITIPEDVVAFVIEYYVGVGSASDPEEEYALCYSTTEPDAYSYYPDEYILSEKLTADYANWVRKRHNLIELSGESIYLAFLHNTLEAQSLIKITDIKIIQYGGTFESNDNDIIVKPESTRLLQNYPNPFNPSTSVQFSVETQHAVSVLIDIFNIRGQKVRSLVNGEFGAGEHSVVWNGNDDSGNAVGSGLYFYRLKTDDYTETRKMMLLK